MTGVFDSERVDVQIPFSLNVFYKWLSLVMHDDACFLASVNHVLAVL